MGGITLDKRIVGKPKEKYWVSYIKGRIKKNKNFLGFISGQTGSGKSWSSLSICEALDKDFNIDRVVFSGLELMDLINSGKLKRGSAICFEEVGVEMNNKNWASVTNKMLNYLIQTFRHRCFILIMNSPYMDFVDSSTRKLFHAEMATMGIDFTKKECKLKPLLIQYNSKLRKFYFKRLRVIRPEGVMPIDFWNVGKPSDELIQAYEQKKRDYTDNLNKRIYLELEDARNKMMKKYDAKLTEIQKDTLAMLKDGKTVWEIAIARERTEHAVRNSMTYIRKKGYELIPMYDGSKITHYRVVEPKQAEKENNV